jgi:CelD/BcsL family acetyltransferase involved in cellulose biosynthesis
MTTVREINDPAELAPLIPVWNQLLLQTPGATFFQSAEWLLVYWKHFGERQQLRLLVVSEGDRITGILPLVVRASRRRIAGVRVLTYPLDDWGSYFGPIGPDTQHTLHCGLEHIRRTPRDWQVIELPWVDTLGVDGGATELAFAGVGLQSVAEPWHTSALIDLSGFDSWEAYWASRESRWRNNVRRSEKKLAAKGKITYVRYRPAAGADTDPRWDLFEVCQSIAEASWQAESTTGTTLTHEGVRAFLRECHAVAARAGALDVNILYVDGQPVAFNYAYYCHGHVFGLRTGFDAVAASEGAGTVLQARMIADSFARGDHTYDLGAGYLDCKRYWLTEARSSYRYSHFPTHVPVARLMQAKRSLEQWWRGGKHPAIAGK